MLESAAGISVGRFRPKNGWMLLTGGITLGLSFPPFPFPWLAWVALVPLLKAWDEAPSWSVALRRAFFGFLATFAVAFSWPLFHAMPHVALASMNGLVLLPLWMAIPFGIAWPVKRTLGRALGFTALIVTYLIMEAALGQGPLALPWPLLAHTQAEALRYNQFADLTGAPGLTLWVLLLNVTVYSAILNTSNRRRLRLAGLAVLLGAPLIYGALRVHTLPPAEQTLRMGLIQPGTPPLAWADLTDLRRINDLIAISDSLLLSGDAPGLMVWPETAVPLVSDSTTVRETEGRLQAWADTRGVSLLTGAISVTNTRPGNRAYRNTALLFTPHEPVRSYAKRKLVPFAEHVPFVNQMPWLRALSVPAGGVSGYEPGGSSTPLQVGPTSVGVMICLESVFGSLGRSYAAQEAELLVSITQDGWWGRTAGYRQHLAFTRLRSIETRRAVAQASVSGTTALILPDGSVPVATDWMERAGLTIEVPLHTTPTFYTTHGDWLNRLAYLGALLLLTATAVQRVRDVRRTRSERSYA